MFELGKAFENGNGVVVDVEAFENRGKREVERDQGIVREIQVLKMVER